MASFVKCKKKNLPGISSWNCNNTNMEFVNLVKEQICQEKIQSIQNQTYKKKTKFVAFQKVSCTIVGRQKLQRVRLPSLAIITAQTSFFSHPGGVGPPIIQEPRLQYLEHVTSHSAMRGGSKQRPSGSTRTTMLFVIFCIVISMIAIAGTWILCHTCVISAWKSVSWKLKKMRRSKSDKQTIALSFCISFCSFGFCPFNAVCIRHWRI